MGAISAPTVRADERTRDKQAASDTELRKERRGAATAPTALVTTPAKLVNPLAGDGFLPPARPSADPSLGFDACDAPSVAEMYVWRAHSPYSTVAIYIGGELRHCTNPVLDHGVWVKRVVEQGWRIIPIYVGPQAPCTGFRVVIDAANAAAHGATVGRDTVARARIVGLPPGAPIYYDLEAYRPVDPACTDAVNAFVSAWVGELRNAGYKTGLYGTPESGLNAQVQAAANPGLATVDAIWIARWSGRPNLFGYDPQVLPQWMWANRARIHQYRGDHDETWGGVTLNIDSNLVHGPVYPEG
jgi:Rv2525c-like, glycoside hydrolase-like domain